MVNVCMCVCVQVCVCARVCKLETDLQNVVTFNYPGGLYSFLSPSVVQ